MAEMDATPRQPVLGALSDYLAWMKRMGNKIPVPDISPANFALPAVAPAAALLKLAQMAGGPGSLMLGNAPEEVDNWSYGDYPFEVPAESNLPQETRDGRALNMLDVAGAVPMLGAPMKAMRGLHAMASTPEALARMHAATQFIGVPDSFSTVSNVIKPKGGNWLSGSVEDALKGLRQWDVRNDRVPLNPRDSAEEAERLSLPGRHLNDWIDKKLAAYVRNDMATPGDPLRLQADAFPAKKADMLANVQARLYKVSNGMREEAARRGVPEHHLTSMRQDQIALEKEKALIEGRQGLHVSPEELNVRPESVNGRDMPYFKLLREQAGFPGDGLGQSLPARTWEAVTDNSVHSDPAGDYLRGRNDEDMQALLDKNPWIAKVPPETRVHGLYENATPRDLGFNHLVDELRNSINPDSGLPPHLMLKYQDLPKIRVDQAADHVDKINAWRNAQQVEANQQLANNAATHVVKEYPEHGMKWVELKKPENTGRVNTRELTDDELMEQDYVAAEQAGLDVGAPGYDDFIEQRRNSGMGSQQSEDESIAHLRNALKYEGDTMQHCVGGYCPAVANGSTRIFSLRDHTGRPHATVEMAPSRNMREYLDRIPDPERNTSLAAARGDDAFAPHWTFRDYVERNRSGNGDFDAVATKLLEQHGIKGPPPNILQIKGVKNQKPKDEVLPFVQDFVKTQGPWSGVGDLHHTDLMSHKDAYMALDQKDPKLADLFMENAPAEGWFTEEDLKKLVPGYAHGGLVTHDYDPAAIDHRVNALLDEMGL